jgi:DNA-binding IclR family transcriptional regulator
LRALEVPGRRQGRIVTRESGNRLGIRSVENAATILTAMAGAGRSLRLKELAALTGMHPGKVHRYLVSLSRTGLVEQETASGHYGLGPVAISVGLAALGTVDVVKSAAEVLPGLRDEVGETVFLALWGNGGPVIVRLEESEKAVYVNARVGWVLPVLRTATGRVFAAFLQRTETRDLIEAERSQPGASTMELIDRMLAEVRVKGLASVVGDLVQGVSALAAPVFDHEGKIAAVLGVVGQQQQLNVDPDSHVAQILKRTAGGLSKRLGFQE